MSIFGWQGDVHNLSKGAFDSISITKPGNASLLLLEHMGGSFDDAFEKLTLDYHKIVSSSDIQGHSFWKEHIKPGLKKVGGMAWDLAKPIIFESLAYMTGMGLPATLLVGTAETMMSKYLEDLPEAISDPIKGQQALRLNKGQWVFIEKEASLRRRRRMKVFKTSLAEVDPDLKKVAKTVEFGFYVMPSYNDHARVQVFNIDEGRLQSVQAKQIRVVSADIQKTVDEDENLSVLRELFFYKSEAAEFKRTNPKNAILPGRNVVFNKLDYMLIETNGVKALLEDPKGHTQVVDYKALTRGVSRSTAGRGDDFFNKSNDQAIYTGQWVMAPSREWVLTDYSVDMELAVVYRVEKDGNIDIFYCMDGKGYRRKEELLKPFPPNFQQLYSAKQPFKMFKMGAVEGDMEKTERYELGSKYAQICVGEYDHTRLYLGTGEPETGKVETEKTKIIEHNPVKTTTVGNSTKEKVDAREEIIAKTGLTSADIDHIIDENWEEDSEEEEEYYEGGGGDGGSAVLLGIIAIGALIMTGFGGAVAAV
jgi:hypothetical protein